MVVDGFQPEGAEEFVGDVESRYGKCVVVQASDHCVLSFRGCAAADATFGHSHVDCR